MFDKLTGMPDFDTSAISGMPIKEKSFAGARFLAPPAGTHFVDCDFSGTLWDGVTLDGQLFTRCNFSGAQFIGCILRTVRFFECVAASARFHRTLTTECHWESGAWGDCQWQECRLARQMVNAVRGGNWEFRVCDISFSTLSSLAFTGLRVESSLIRDLSLVESKVHDQCWQECVMERVIAANSTFGGGQWLGCQGINNRWMGIKARHLAYQSCNFEQSAWSTCEIDGGDFQSNLLRIAHFDSGQLQRLRFKGNTLFAIAFDGSLLRECEFRERDVSHFSLRNARLESCDLNGITGSDLDARGCTMQGTTVSGARFVDANVAGQQPEDWRGADLDLARFEIPEELQDLEWWKTCRPGATRSTQ